MDRRRPRSAFCTNWLLNSIDKLTNKDLSVVAWGHTENLLARYVPCRADVWPVKIKNNMCADTRWHKILIYSNSLLYIFIKFFAFYWGYHLISKKIEFWAVSLAEGLYCANILLARNGTVQHDGHGLYRWALKT